ncbi:adenine DNA glycosylase [Exaiptasia diaphana]|uniref:Adenine DNA glycosylase n=1 Tax=Exaiptasia diaphana TaxID=2652724 RepID=A0A913XIR4_EXADI|nr:adenine DNA glycosylase [Exaiptasia diaphana]KXJ11790.1 A/G-specific adenine DNA glycosylase [Exaiptasia diaphana]
MPRSKERLDNSKEQEHSHDFKSSEEKSVRVKLLDWYDDKKRDLPWRRYANEQDPNKRAYAVWVSEIMLQQTQVATVIDYYNRWMAKWPTVQDLANASLEEVNEVWSGLGYYSRGKRLFEGSKKVCEELNGRMPSDAVSLEQKLPGVGRYTAGAIASIAFKEATGVVDGNVIRVLSRLRLIGANSTSKIASGKFWQLSNSLVDSARPGDFNQAMMELGATVCTPKTPQCAMCPLKVHCMAYKQVEDSKKTKTSEFLTKGNMQNGSRVSADIEECGLCLCSTWDVSLGVCNYPTKPKKKEIKQETFGACLLQKNNENGLVVVKRPESGLLAGLWEFPNTQLDTTQNNATSTITRFLSEEIGLTKFTSQKELGEVMHKFSHCHHIYKVYHFVCEETKLKQVLRPVKWITKEEIKDAAMPMAMRKIFRLYEDTVSNKRKLNTFHNTMKKQKTMDSFFKAK